VLEATGVLLAGHGARRMAQFVAVRRHRTVLLAGMRLGVRLAERPRAQWRRRPRHGNGPRGRPWGRPDGASRPLGGNRAAGIAYSDRRRDAAEQKQMSRREHAALVSVHALMHGVFSATGTH
jgi:hypothetical protein